VLAGSTPRLVVAEPESAFEAVNLTEYDPASPNLGCHTKLPVVFDPPGVKEASFVPGSPEKSAVKDVIASPSGSLALTLKAIKPFSSPRMLSGAATTGD